MNFVSQFINMHVFRFICPFSGYYRLCNICSRTSRSTIIICQHCTTTQRRSMTFTRWPCEFEIFPFFLLDVMYWRLSNCFYCCYYITMKIMRYIKLVMNIKVILTHKSGLQRYCDTTDYRSAVNQIWILKMSKDLLKLIKSR
jgi:hypothetical protein